MIRAGPTPLAVTGPVLVTPIPWHGIFGLNGRSGSGYIARDARQMVETADGRMLVFAMAIKVGFGPILRHLESHLATALVDKEMT